MSKNKLFDQYLKVFKLKYTPEIEPVIHYVVGQAGAGKSGTSNDIKSNHLNQNIATIDTDQFRKFHKSYKEAKKEILKNDNYPKDTNYSEESQKFASTFNTNLREFCKRNKYSMIFETTPSSPEWIVDNLKEMKNNGFKVDFTIISTKEEVSRIRLLNRYLVEKTNEHFGRLVSHDFHNSNVNNNYKLINLLQENGIKSINICFNGNLIKNVNIEQAKSMILENESRDLRESEITDMINILRENIILIKENKSKFEKEDLEKIIKHLTIDIEELTNYIEEYNLNNENNLNLVDNF